MAAKAKDTAAKPKATKSAAAKPKSDKPNALQQPLNPSKELAAVIGEGQVARGQAVSKIWDYIRKNDLQDSKDRRQINADAKLKPVFGGKDQVSMFEMNKHLAGHLSK